MNDTQLEIAEIVVKEAIESLAQVHETTKQNIYIGLSQGHEGLTAGLKKLIKAGCEAAENAIKAA